MEKNRELKNVSDSSLGKLALVDIRQSSGRASQPLNWLFRIKKAWNVNPGSKLELMN
jgi:hypothetical protein